MGSTAFICVRASTERCEQRENKLPNSFRNTETSCIALEEKHIPVITNKNEVLQKKKKTKNEVLQTVSTSWLPEGVSYLLENWGEVSLKFCFSFWNLFSHEPPTLWVYYHEYKGQWEKKGNIQLWNGTYHLRAAFFTDKTSKILDKYKFAYL